MTERRRTSQPLPAAPGRQIGPYRVESELGRGSNAVVYLARHREAGKQVALKVLLHTDPEGVARFQQEARLASRLEDPGIVGVHDVGVHGRHHYLAMDYVVGKTLQERLRRGPLPPVEVARLLRDLARTMERAHEVGIVHRDLKPANIIIDKARRRGRVTDFGLARDNHRLDALTRSGEVIGTPYYMAPEQFRAERGVDHRVDVYALGVIGYECLAGQRPFEGRTAVALAKLVTKGDFVPLLQVDPALPPELAAICTSAMSYRAEDRHPSAARLADALDTWLDRQAAPAPADPPATEGAGPPRALVAAAALSVLVLGLALWMASARRRAPASPSPASSPQQPLTAVESPAAASPPAPPPVEVPPAPPGALADLSHATAPWARQLVHARLLAATRSGAEAVEQALQEAAAAAREAGDERGRARVELERLGYLRRRGRYEEALRTADQAVVQREDQIGYRTRLELAFCHHRLDHPTPALALVDEVDGADGEGAAGLHARVLGDIFRGRLSPRWQHDLQRALEVDPAYALARESQVFALLLDGQAAQARDAGQALLETVPDDPRLFLALASAQLKLGDYEPALGSYRQALELIGAHAPVSFSLAHARLALQLERPDDARWSLGLADQGHPDDPQVLLHLGLLEWTQGDKQQARQSWRQATARPMAQLRAALNSLGAAQTQRGVWAQLVNAVRLDPRLLGAQAGPLLRRRCQAVPEAAREPLERALLLACQGQPWTALEPHLTRALQAAPDSLALALEQVRLLVGRDLYAEARTAAARARELGPTPAQEHELARLEADLIWREGNLHDSVTAWRAVHEADPDGVEGLTAQAEATYLSEHDNGRALQQIERALRVQPDHPRAGALRALLIYLRNEPFLAIQAADALLVRDGAIDTQLLSFRTFAVESLLRTLGPESARYVHQEWKTALNASQGAYHRLGAVGRALVPEHKDELDWAATHLQECLEREPRRAHVHEYLGALAILRGDSLEQVLAHWERAHELEPRNGISERFQAEFLRRFPDQEARLQALR